LISLVVFSQCLKLRSLIQDAEKRCEILREEVIETTHSWGARAAYGGIGGSCVPTHELFR